jgi:hypothetical protein
MRITDLEARGVVHARGGKRMADEIAKPGVRHHGKDDYFSLSPIRLAAVHRLTGYRPDWRA